MDDSTNRDSDDYTAAPIQAGSFWTVLKVFAGVVIAAGLAAALLLPFTRGGVHEAARRNNCLGKMRQIALALHNYADAHHGMLPPAYTTDADRKPLHSWRTLILPYMEEKALYDSIDLTKPWDDPGNAKAAKTSIDAYTCPSFPGEEPLTTYLAIVTPNSCFLPTEPRRLADITGGSSKILMLIEVGEEHAVPWMKPIDADESVVLGIGKSPSSKVYHSNGVFNVALVDGSARGLSDVPADLMRAMISVRPEDKVGLKIPE